MQKGIPEDTFNYEEALSMQKGIPEDTFNYEL